MVAGGDSDLIAQRHAQHCLTLAEDAEQELWGPHLRTWLERLETEHENLRAALRWSVGRGETESALRLGASLRRFWQLRGYFSEGLRWLEGALSWTSGASAAVRAKALEAAAYLARDLGDYPRANFSL